MSKNTWHQPGRRRIAGVWIGILMPLVLSIYEPPGYAKTPWPCGKMATRGVSTLPGSSRRTPPIWGLLVPSGGRLYQPTDIDFIIHDYPLITHDYPQKIAAWGQTHIQIWEMDGSQIKVGIWKQLRQTPPQPAVVESFKRSTWNIIKDHGPVGCNNADPLQPSCSICFIVFFFFLTVFLVCFFVVCVCVLLEWRPIIFEVRSKRKTACHQSKTAIKDHSEINVF